jgi:hypothetical protein
MPRSFRASVLAAALAAAGSAATPAGAQEPDLIVAPTAPGKPAVARGARYMSFSEKFNRYYTDPAWKPSKVVYVSPNGSSDGATREAPMAVRAAVEAARPGTQIYFLRGAYQGCYDFSKRNSGTYDDPVVLFAERNRDATIGVSMNCCGTGRQTCFNLEDADYIAIDGFELVGGRYGARVVGRGYAASEHSRGIAVLNNLGRDQSHDPFFSAQSDWTVWERNVGHGAKAGDGHGLYISNGSDWNIVRFNETFSNASSDFQVNADPTSTCEEVGIRFDDPRCDAYAGTGEGGQGASDYFLIDSNFFHHGRGPGANFTSLRRSVIRNNIFGLHARHNVSFWQETDNPRLGSRENKVVHNLFVTTGRQGVQFIKHSTLNEFANNVILGVQITPAGATANSSATLMEVDETVGGNVYRANLYVSGRLVGRSPNAQESARPDFAAEWFAKFPLALNRSPNDFQPSAAAPFAALGTASPHAPADRNGTARSGRVSLGPIELRR